MALIQKRKLILVETKKGTFTPTNGEQQGTIIHGWHLTFLNAEGKLVTAWTTDEEYCREIKDVEEYHVDDAKDYWFTVREFQGRTKYSIVSWPNCEMRRGKTTHERTDG